MFYEVELVTRKKNFYKNFPVSNSSAAKLRSFLGKTHFEIRHDEKNFNSKKTSQQFSSGVTELESSVISTKHHFLKI